MVEFRVLGALRVVDGDRIVVPSTPKMRRVLALLAVRPGQVVRLDQIIEELWGERAPRSAGSTTQNYVYRLRKLLAAELDERVTGPLLTTNASGYALQVEPEAVDAEVFAARLRTGQRMLDEGRPREAADVLGRALALWRGSALADVECGSVLGPHIALLDEQYLRARELQIRADMQMGEHAKLVGELKLLVARYPLNEWFHGQLITALRRTGRRSEALQAYRSLRTVLRDEVGLEPAAEIQQLHQQVLADVDEAPGPRGRGLVPVPMVSA